MEVNTMKRIMFALLFIILSCWIFGGCGEITTNESIDSASDNRINSGTGGQIISNPGTGGSLVSAGTGGSQDGSPDAQCLSNLPLNSLCRSDCDCLSGSCREDICQVKLKVNGDPCNRDKECQSNWCHPELGICRDKPVPRQPGETCVWDWECEGYC